MCVTESAASATPGERRLKRQVIIAAARAFDVAEYQTQETEKQLAYEVVKAMTKKVKDLIVPRLNDEVLKPYKQNVIEKREGEGYTTNHPPCDGPPFGWAEQFVKDLREARKATKDLGPPTGPGAPTKKEIDDLDRHGCELAAACEEA